VGFYCTDENLGSRMKTFLSVINSYDKIMDFIFPPNLSFFMMNFELVPGRCFFHSLNVLYWCSPVSSVGKDDWNHGKAGPNPIYYSIEIYRTYITRQTYL
jgi:hypothetical protein